MVYVLSPLQGIGIALLLNSSTALISDVIGEDTDSAGFVYGIYSFLDKFANGFMLFWLVAEYSEDAWALRWILSLTPTLAAVFTGLFCWYGQKKFSQRMVQLSPRANKKKIKRRSRRKKSDGSPLTESDISRSDLSEFSESDISDLSPTLKGKELPEFGQSN